jgi:hypothetical protein
VPGNPKRRQDVAMLNEMPEEMIFSMVEAGKSIADICIDLGISKRALDEWIDEKRSRCYDYTRAHACG